MFYFLFNFYVNQRYTLVIKVERKWQAMKAPLWQRVLIGLTAIVMIFNFPKILYNFCYISVKYRRVFIQTYLDLIAISGICLTMKKQINS